jgi:hypothetical protein
LNAPRGDAEEAIVLVGAWRNVEGVLNRSGVALVLTLARYFKSISTLPDIPSKAHRNRMVIVVQGYHIRHNRR